MFRSRKATSFASLSGISGVSFLLELSCRKSLQSDFSIFDHAFALHVFDGFVIIFGGFVIIIGGFVIIFSGFEIVIGGFVIIIGGFVITIGGFVIIIGGFVTTGERDSYWSGCSQ